MKLTDAGLKYLKVLAELRKLDVQDTAITDAGMKKLRKALPKELETLPTR